MVKLAFGSVGDSFSATSIKAYVAEFIATLLFVFAGVGSAIAYGEYNTAAAQLSSAQMVDFACVAPLHAWMGC